MSAAIALTLLAALCVVDVFGILLLTRRPAEGWGCWLRETITAWRGRELGWVDAGGDGVASEIGGLDTLSQLSEPGSGYALPPRGSRCPAQRHRPRPRAVAAPAPAPAPPAPVALPALAAEQSDRCARAHRPPRGREGREALYGWGRRGRSEPDDGVAALGSSIRSMSRSECGRPDASERRERGLLVVNLASVTFPNSPRDSPAPAAAWRGPHRPPGGRRRPVWLTGCDRPDRSRPTPLTLPAAGPPDG